MASKPPRRSAAVGTLMVLVSGLAGPAARAQEIPPEPGAAGFAYPDVIEIDDRGLDAAGIAAELATVPVDSAEVAGLVDAIEEAALLGYLSSIEAADASRRIEALETERDTVAAERERLTEARRVARARLVEVRDSIADLAVVAYVEGGVSLLFDDEWSVADDNSEANAREALVQVGRNQMSLRDELVVRIESLTVKIDDRTARLEELNAGILAQTARRETATVDQVRFEAEVDGLVPQVAPARARAVVAGLELPMVVLDAYFRAERTMGAEQPGCGIEWETLAGIGRIESRHGTAGGGSVTRTGQTTGRILGIPLNGERATQEITDTDGGALDGDNEFDRAVGPMQFIPGTWRRFARDGDGDGSSDPHNLYDAALSAAGYLCRGRSGLDGPGLSGALLAYNHSGAYVSAVRGWRDTYAAPGLPGPLDSE